MGDIVEKSKDDQSTDLIREDDAPAKRMELSVHTSMSRPEGVNPVEGMMERAALWGHKAIAITDHGDIQAFSDAYQHLKKLRKTYPNFKVIYGMEGYLVDDTASIVTNGKGQSLDGTFVALDLETTGFSFVRDEIIEIAAVKLVDGKKTACFSNYVKPKQPISERITELTSITNQMVENAAAIEEALPDFFQFCEGAALVAYNAEFVMGFIKQKANDLGITCNHTWLDTARMAMALLPGQDRFTLRLTSEALGVDCPQEPSTADEAECIGQIFLKLIERLKRQGIYDLDALQGLGKGSVTYVKHHLPSHVTLLVRNEVGMRNLRKLVSLAQDQYRFAIPKIPKSLLLTHREGLLIGSACSNGELCRAILVGKSDEELLNIASDYDFLEIQPADLDLHLMDDPFYCVNSKEDLFNIRRKIVSLGEKLRKPVVATGDVHFLDLKDWEIRNKQLRAAGFRVNKPEFLYFRTTEEMLEDFSFLSPGKAYAVVVKNTNRIADMISDVVPGPSDVLPPVIENGAEDLAELCYRKAHELYGDKLPDVIEKRLKWELDAVTGNGYAGFYMLMQTLVRKSLQEAYLVGARGLVGSSFAAYVAGITEVNPLPPHYLCPKCHYVDFDSEAIIKQRGGCGYDLPNKKCPVCGVPLNKYGFDISPEVFMGLDGKKMPNINLNFSGEILNAVQKETERLFGEAKCFLSSTLGTTVFHLVYGYVQKDTTDDAGIQHEADHRKHRPFDYNLLKFNLVKHDDPTMLRYLENDTGFDPEDVPFDDANVMALFQGTDVLGITPDQIGDTQLGCLGIPEFGTDYAMQMLLDAKPTEFSQLVRIIGLSHIDGGWLGNAKDLIVNGQATISEVIGTRDDIMTYLVDRELDQAESFQIMEAVRKGKIAKGTDARWEEWKANMKKHGVPDWYIQSCEKIDYLFPKAHCASYMMMVWRIAYYKVYYPKAFYTAWFSMQKEKLDFGMVFQTPEMWKKPLDRYRTMDHLTPSQQDEYRTLRVAEEMYARGIEIELAE